MMNYHFIVELRNASRGFEWMGHDKNLGYMYTNLKKRKKFYSVQDAIYAIQFSREDLEFHDAIVYLVEGENMYRVKDYNDRSITT